MRKCRKALILKINFKDDITWTKPSLEQLSQISATGLTNILQQEQQTIFTMCPPSSHSIHALSADIKSTVHAKSADFNSGVHALTADFNSVNALTADFKSVHSLSANLRSIEALSTRYF